MAFVGFHPRRQIGDQRRLSLTKFPAFGHLFEACPDIKWIGENVALSDNQALSTWRRTATLQDGTVQDWMGCDIYTFEEGLVTCKDSYFKNRS